MTPTVHKILIHSAVFAEYALLPIGQLSEEAVEARNKYLRLYRQNFSRKFSRQACNMDVLNRLLLTSDPLITGINEIEFLTFKIEILFQVYVKFHAKQESRFYPKHCK